MKYFSMFSGIGGFEKGINDAIGEQNAECIGFSEIDKYAISIYKHKFPGHKLYGNARDIVPEQLPDFDLLCGGFPCQAFSVAGKRGGFEDTRGTLFFEIARIARIKRPKLLLLENVKGLLSHDHGRTFGTICATISDMGYFCEWQVLNSKDFGVPQNRERVFIVGHLREEPRRQIFPIGQTDRMGNGQSEWEETRTTNTLTATYGRGPAAVRPLIADWRNDEGLRIRKDGCSPTLTSSHTSDGKTDISMCPPLVIPVLTPDRPEKRQNGRRFKENGDPAFTITAQDRHGIYNGQRIRRLTPIECERLQGFPDNWTKYGEGGIEISDSQRYKCCGNSVTTNVIRAMIERLYA